MSPLGPLVVILLITVGFDLIGPWNQPHAVLILGLTVM